VIWWLPIFRLFYRRFVYLRIDCYFRAHMEYKRPDWGFKIPWSALALLGKFSNQRLGVYTPYVHENSNQSLYLHFLHHFLLIKNNILTICEGYMAIFQKDTTRGINPASGTANTREYTPLQWDDRLWTVVSLVKSIFSCLTAVINTQWYICTVLAVGTVRFVFKGVLQIRNK